MLNCYFWVKEVISFHLRHWTKISVHKLVRVYQKYKLIKYKGQQKYPVSDLCARCLKPARRHFSFKFVCYATMSNCSQNCWIDWNSAVLCFKRLFHIGLWMFAQFVRPLLATIFCIMGNLVPAYTCITYFPVGKKTQRTKNCVTAPILKPTDVQSSDCPAHFKYRFYTAFRHSFFVPLITILLSLTILLFKFYFWS